MRGLDKICLGQCCDDRARLLRFVHRMGGVVIRVGVVEHIDDESGLTLDEQARALVAAVANRWERAKLDDEFLGK